jgi:AraC family transcriptional activator of tynA and feaB
MRTEVMVMQRESDAWTLHESNSARAHDAWSSMLRATHLPWSVRELTPESPAFNATVRRRHLADLILVDCTCDPCWGTRRAHDIARTDGEYLVMLMTLSDREIVGQAGRQSQLQPGSVVI